MVMQEIHDAVIRQARPARGIIMFGKIIAASFWFELLMAPYAIAHLKLGRLLEDTGYQFQTDQRLGIYLTNTLEEAVTHSVLSLLNGFPRKQMPPLILKD